MSARRKNSKLATASGSVSIPVIVTKATVKPPARFASNASAAATSTFLQNKAKDGSQEDLTKSKERSLSRTKHIQGAGSAGTAAVTRKPLSSKETQKSDNTREKNKMSSNRLSSSSASLSGRSSILSRRPKENVSKKSGLDKTSLEEKIKDLTAFAENKDVEITLLKTKLDHTMHLLKQQQESEGNSTVVASSSRREFSSLVKLSDGEASRDDDTSSVRGMQVELSRLQDENMKLREQVDVMMLAMNNKDAVVDQSLFPFQKENTQDIETLSNDNELSSSIDDIASAASADALKSASISRSTSTENMLDGISTNGTTSTYVIRSGEKLTEDCMSDASSATVACLTERIHRMEESHISTNEELEATVQELTDLQKSVPELTIDNNRLQHEKEYLVKQLSVAEKKLTEQATESKHLQALLSDHLTDGTDHSDLKQQYLVLLNEREQLLRVEESLNKELQNVVNEKKDSRDLVEAFQERTRHLERELNQSNTEKSLVGKKLKEARDTIEEQNEVVQRLHEELDDEHHRIEDLFKKSGTFEKSTKITETLKNEIKKLKEKYLLLEEDYSLCQNENEKLDARVAELEEEQEAYVAKTKKDLSELSEVIDRLQEDLRVKQTSLDDLNETLFVMEDSVEQHIAMKKHDNHIIKRLQVQISELKEERFRLEKEMQQLKKEQRNQSDDWKELQNDLQMAVKIANHMNAEIQSEVAEIREENQVLDESLTQLRVENEQLRRKMMSNMSSTPLITEAAALKNSASRPTVDISALRESYKRRTLSENSPGVQSLIKSFDNQKTEPESPVSPCRSSSFLSNDSSPSMFSPGKSQKGRVSGDPSRTESTPIMATVAPIRRQHTMPSLTPLGTQTTNSSISNKLKSNSKAGKSGSIIPEIPDGMKTNASGDLQLTSLLRHNSEKQEAKTSSSDLRKPPSTDAVDGSPAKSDHRGNLHSTPVSIKRTISISTPSGDPVASLARHYGGSKRNALLKWCQEKTRTNHGVDITNFSSSWSDGLALCGLLHSYLPAHIPYESLEQTYAATTDEKTRKQLQAKNFRLAFAAAESVGIDPVLTTEEMTTKERPDWQRVMTYVTQIYKYFET